MLYSEKFLKRLSEHQNNHELYIKIISLSFKDETPREELEGICTGGSLTVDGTSTIRRTCSLQMISDNIFSQEYWCFKNKFKLMIGVRNLVDSNYPDIIWFPQGIYVITDFSSNISTTGTTISISGKDKMCLLDGSIGGKLFANHDFGTISVVGKDGIERLEKVPIRTILQEILENYGAECTRNILINDVDDFGYELVSYKGTEPLYLLTEASDQSVLNITFDGETQFGDYTLENVPKYYSFNALQPYINNNCTKLDYGDTTAYAAKISYDETIGYHCTELVYNEETLTLTAGTAVVEAIKKIQEMLGSNYEFFFDEYGHFIFQKKKMYRTDWFTIVNGELSSPVFSNLSYGYRFTDESLLTNISLTPTISGVKNDFSIVGSKESADGSTITIHGRFAIDKKPTSYTTYDGNIIFVAGEDREAVPIYYYYWTELKSIFSKEIFENEEEITEEQQKNLENWEDVQGAVYEVLKKGEQLSQDLITRTLDIARSLNIEEIDNLTDILEGLTTAEKTGPDWRELIYQMAKDYFANHEKQDFFVKIDKNNNGLYPGGRTGYEIYYADIYEFWPKIYSLETGWIEDVFSNPANLPFWFDFLDSSGELSKLSIPEIGDRIEVENSTTIKSVYYAETPNVIIVYSDDTIEGEDSFSYTEITVPDNYQDYFFRSSQGVSIIEQANTMLQNSVGAAESISFSAIPLFFLQPNTRVQVADYGDYSVDRISYNLAYNGTMSITGNKIYEEVLG